MIKKVAILGCGWLGLPLAKALLDAGYLVHGSTTSKDKLAGLTAEGIQAFRIRLGEGGVEGNLAGFLKDVELLIVNIPPRIKSDRGENYARKMTAVSRAVRESGVPKLLFVSSTSVYGNKNGLVTEATSPAPKTESGRQVRAAEQLFQEDPDLQTIIVRFGGLIGPGRHPVKQLAGKKGLVNGDDPVNLIHLNDCIHLIKTVVEGGHWNQVFNGVYPAHPKKREYYTREALKRHLAVPEYESSDPEISGKCIISKNYLTKSYSFFTSIFF